MDAGKPGKISNFFTHIQTFTSQYFTIVSFVGIVWGGFVVYDNWKDNNEKMNEKFENLIKSEVRQQKTDSLLLEGQTEIRNEFEEFKMVFEQQTKTINSLQKSYIKYISNDKALTKQDFLDYMEGLTVDEKKNYLNNYQNPTQPN
jgi:hypothetical protein